MNPVQLAAWYQAHKTIASLSLSCHTIVRYRLEAEPISRYFNGSLGALHGAGRNMEENIR